MNGYVTSEGARIMPPAKPINPPRCNVCGVVGGMEMNACGHGWTDEEREERWMEIAAEEDPEPTVEEDLDLAIALLHNRPDPHGDLRDDGYARLAMAWTDQFDLLMGRYRKRTSPSDVGGAPDVDHP